MCVCVCVCVCVGSLFTYISIDRSIHSPIHPSIYLEIDLPI